MHLEDDTLLRYKSGLLSKAEADRVESHLEACESCGVRFDELDPRADPLVRVLFGGTSTTQILNGPAGIAGDATDSLGHSAFAHYEIEHELGRGGMGIVYKARDQRIQRSVALKIISPQREWRPEDRARFQVEANAAAHLQHANIVQIFDFGERNGTLYCAFEYVDGGSLAEHLAMSPLSNVETAQIIATVADAIQYAHQRSVLHRDLKPDNVLLTTDGTPKIADFGLAKRLDGADSRTLEGIPLGTPAYMSPEQAEGSSELGPATDVYSLGAIMYECLVGQPVFQGSVLSILDQVKHAEPVGPRKLRKDIDRDLEAICLRCLQKSPNRRLQPSELAKELRRFMAGLPVRSRAPGLGERWLKVAKRNPLATTFAVLAVAAILTALTGISSYSLRLQDSNQQLTTALDESTRTVFALQLQRATQLAGLDPLQAQVLLDDESRCPLGLRDFYWSILRCSCNRETTPFRFDGDVLAIDVAPDGRTIAVGTRSGILAVGTLDETSPSRHFQAHQSAVTGVRFNSDGSQIATTGKDGEAYLWATNKERPLRAIHSNGRMAINGVSFLQDSRLVTAHADGRLRVWSNENEAVLEPAREDHPPSIICMAVNADGSLVASGDYDGTLRVWRTETWDELAHVDFDFQYVTAMEFHPTRPQVLVTTGSDRTVRRWIVENGDIFEQARYGGQFDEKGSCIAFSKTGRLLAAGSYDGDIQVWEWETQRRVFTASCPSRVLSIAFDGEHHVLVGLLDGVMQRWDLSPRLDPKTLAKRESGRAFNSLAYDNLSDRVVTGDDAGRVSLWDPADGRELRRWESPAGNPIESLAVGASGNLAWETDESIFVCDSAAAFPDATRQVAAGTLSKLMAVTRFGIILSTSSFTTQMVDSIHGEPIWELDMDADLLRCSEEQDIMVALLRESEAGGSAIWIGNAKSGKGHFITVLPRVNQMALTTDGQQLCVGTDDGDVAIYDLEGHLVAHSRGHPKEIAALAFSHDGKSLVSTGFGGEVRFWDPHTSTKVAERGKLETPTTVAVAVAFDATDTRLFYACTDGTIRVNEIDGS